MLQKHKPVLISIALGLTKGQLFEYKETEVIEMVLCHSSARNGKRKLQFSLYIIFLIDATDKNIPRNIFTTGPNVSCENLLKLK